MHDPDMASRRHSSKYNIYKYKFFIHRNVYKSIQVNIERLLKGRGRISVFSRRPYSKEVSICMYSVDIDDFVVLILLLRPFLLTKMDSNNAKLNRVPSV